jgi:hypothetical protein
VGRREAFSPLAPRPGEVFGTTEGREIKVRFQWTIDQRQAQESPLELEASPDREFKTGVRKALIGSTHPPLEKAQVSVALPPSQVPTTWYWRVRALNNRSISRVESFVLQPEPRPVALYPLAEFLWDGTEGAESYDVEVRARDSATFKPLSKRSAGGETHVSFDGFDPGLYSWRIRARKDAKTSGEWSPPRELTVVAGDVGLPPPPDELDAEIVPRPRHTSVERSLWESFSSWILPSAWAADEAAPIQHYNVRLKWRAVPGVSRYRIQIAKDRAFEEMITESETDEASWVWAYQPGMENTRGRVFYRVASVNPQGKTGRYSSPKPVPLPTAALQAMRRQRTHGRGGPDLFGATEGSGASSAEAATPPTSVEPDATVKVLESLWSKKLALHTGLGSLDQTSAETDLTGVSLTGPFVQNKVSLDAARQRRYSDGNAVTWTGRIQLWLAAYDRPDLPRTTNQERVRPIKARLSLFRRGESVDTAGAPGRWRLFFGGEVDYAFRWIKNGPQSVAAKAAPSVGPALRVTGVLGASSRFVPQELGATLALPISGIATSGQFGAESSAWAEWKLVRVFGRQLAAQLEAELDYLRWSQPKSTSTLAWTIWVAPSIHF